MMVLKWEEEDEGSSKDSNKKDDAEGSGGLKKVFETKRVVKLLMVHFLILMSPTL